MFELNAELHLWINNYNASLLNETIFLYSQQLEQQQYLVTVLSSVSGSFFKNVMESLTYYVLD